MLDTLIVDDSRVFRSSLKDALENHATVRVIASEFSAERGLARIQKGGIQLVLLDMTMPGTSGIGFLQKLRESGMRAPVVIVMSAAYGGTEPEVLEAISLGASGFIPKSSGGPDAFRSVLKDELARLGLQRGRGAGRTSRPRSKSPTTGSLALGHMLGIVSSTGGPAALQTVLAGLAPNFTTPIVVVQHLPPGFAQSMAANLTRRTGRKVSVAEHGAHLESGSIVVAPGDRHLEVHNGSDGLYCKLVDGPKENGCRPAGDRMLRSAARATRGRMVGLCLTGMGNDGATGMSELHGLGGHVIVQDEASSIVWGMPSAVLDAGVPAVVLPLEGIASSLNRKSNRKAA